MKVIDLLNKIANKEELPSNFFFEEIKFTYSKNRGLYLDEDNDTFGERFNLEMAINDEIELIEQEIDIENIEEISELTHYDEYDEQGNILACKINELIKAVKQLDRKIKEE